MKRTSIDELLAAVAEGRLAPAAARAEVERYLTEPLGFAAVDMHRKRRQGSAEVILGEHKSAAQVAGIVRALLAAGDPVLVTRIGAEKAAAVAAETGLTHHPEARALTGNADKVVKVAHGEVAVITAGTSDIPVAEEAALTAAMLGLAPARVFDVGVAGLHRLVAKLPEIERARVLIVVAGMEGALPSVVGGLVDKPVIAVPTSVGYGASAGGYAALLGMLSSCAAGLTVVNIDNGFGAAFAAFRILKDHGHHP
jgi:NCAIR mutase (PurE)-related protein